MIHLPRRSVTRFFIPLIDVLLLLFCIFLLMPLFGEESKSRADVDDLEDQVLSLQKEVELRKGELVKFENVQPELLDLIKLQDELDRLRKEKAQALLKRLLIRVLDIDDKTGELSYFDPSDLTQPVHKIPGKEAALALIARHKKEVPEREQFYQFHFSRDAGVPTKEQADAYRDWFESVANSLHKKETMP